MAQTSEPEAIPQFVPVWDDKETSAVQKVLESDYLNEHKTVREFEKQFSEFVGSKYCVTCMNGTTALYMAILSAKERLAEARIPDHYSIFLYNSCIQAGIDPYIRSVGPDGCMRPEGKGDIVVNANGRTRGTALIEDNSQHVSSHTQGCISTYSFASTKHITLGGQGGAICCDDSETFDRLSRLKDLGRNDRQNLKPMSDRFEMWGFNSKVTEMQAAFGLAQLGKMASRTSRLHEMYQMYRDSLSRCSGARFFDSPPQWHIDILVDDPQKVIDRMKKHRIFCRRYMTPLHMQPIAQNARQDGDLSATKELYAHGLYLPSTTSLTDEQVTRIGGLLADAITQV